MTERSARPAGDVVDAALARIAHRGPDGHGIRVCDTRDGRRLVVGARRLSIMDLTPAGDQPMATADGRFVLVFNGEIYNHPELRRELTSLGRSFRSGCDTEVLLQACAEWGAAGAIERSTGMFAFALVDVLEGTLLLARDRFGIKPLFYSWLEGGLAFASEIGALLEFPGVSRRVNPRRVHDYMTTALTDHGSETLFEDVLSLPPAHALRVSTARPTPLDPEPYWTVDPLEPFAGTRDAAVEKFRDLLFESVSLHLRSDARLGFALSGGMDSSAIVAITRALVGTERELHTFSYVSDDAEITERPWVESVSHAAGTVGHPFGFEARELVDGLSAAVNAQGEPFADPATLVQGKLFSLARREGLSVVLAGQGADELLAGYGRFGSARTTSLLRSGQWVRAARFASRRGGVRSAARTLGVAARAAFASGRDDGAATPDPSASPWLVSDWFDSRGVLPRRTPQHRSLGQALRHSVSTEYLPALLRYDDRMAMASSIENRVPFLTRPLAEFALSLPEEFLLADDGSTKSILRWAMRGVVPDDVIDRGSKLGFAVPGATWLREVGPWMAEELADVGDFGFIEGGTVLAYQHELASGRPDRAMVLWRCLCVSRWMKDFSTALD